MIILYIELIIFIIIDIYKIILYINFNYRIINE